MAQTPSHFTNRSRVGVWTSSSPSPKEDVSKGLSRLDEMGIDYVFPKLSRTHAARALSKTQNYLAGSDSSKVESFVELLEDRSVSQILATRGGYGCLRLPPLLDKVRLPKNHPTLWGYSDLTVMQHYLFTRSHRPWVHSPMLSSGSFYAPNASEKSYWKKILSKESTEFKYKLKSLSSLGASKKLRTHHRGMILGGNLASLITLMGTPWEPRFPSGSFLFLEEVSESPYRLERLLVQLSYHRDFSNLTGVILGHFTDCPKALLILKKWAEEKEILLWGQLQSGHQRANHPLVLGDIALIERKNEKDNVLTLPKPLFGC